MIGPSPYRSKGGMATVIKGMEDSCELNSKFDINIHESYIDGNIIKRLLFSIYSFIQFLFVYKKYDIFHIHVACYGSTFRKWFYVYYLKKRSKKIILHVHGGKYLVFYHNLPEWKKKIVHDLWNKSDIIVALSQEWKREFEKIFAHPNIVVINNGIDIEQFLEARNEVELYKNCFLFLGKIVEGKGVYDIIDAVKNLKSNYSEMKVFLAGEGESELVRKKINEYDLNKQIILVGWVDNNQKIELMKKTATVILPSYNEGLPMCILEGMAAGKVIISTNVGAIPEVISNNENGILVEPGDVKALSKAMTCIMDDVEFDEYCIKNNIEQIKAKFDRKKMHKKIMDIYWSMSK